MQDFMITRKGEELIARMIAGTDSCTFTKAVTSDHKYMNAEDISSLEDIRQTIPLSGIIINDGDTVKVTALLSNKEQEQGYNVRALGLYACDSSENEILYAVSIEPDNPDYMPAFAGKTLSTISYIMNIRVGRSERVKLNVDTGAIPTVEQVNLMQRTIESLEREKVNKTDIIDVTHGGTGKTTAKDAANTLLAGLENSSDHWYDDQNILVKGSDSTSDRDKYFKKPVSKLIELVKTKLSSSFVSSDKVIDVAHGGTGKKTTNEAANTLITGLVDGTVDMTDDGVFITSNNTAGVADKDKFARRSAMNVWNWIKSKLATVATSGSYADLTNKPTIPTIPASLPANGGNADTATSANKVANKLTFSGASVQTYDGSSAVTVNIPTVPTSLPANGGNADTAKQIDIKYGNKQVGLIEGKDLTDEEFKRGYSGIRMLAQGERSGSTHAQQEIFLLGCTNALQSYSSVLQKGLDLGTANDEGRWGTLYVRENLNVSSDRNVKENIEPIKEVKKPYMDFFDNIEIVTYTKKQENYSGQAEYQHAKHYRKRIGIIAQDVEKKLREIGLSAEDFSGVKAEYCYGYSNTSCFISGGYQKEGEEKSYSENTYNWKHRNDLGIEYETYNELLEKDIKDFKIREYRKNIGYICFEDNSKLTKDQPPLKINGIYFIDSEGNVIEAPLNGDIVSYYESNDYKFENPISYGEYSEETKSLTLTFGKMYGTIFLKIPTINISNIEKVVVNADYISEYKMYLLPDPEEIGKYVTANVWDRERTDQILYDYGFDYGQLFGLSAYALQETRKELQEMNEKYKKLEKRISDLTIKQMEE